MGALVQKAYVRPASEASPLMPIRLALVDEDGSDWNPGSGSVAAATTEKAGTVKMAAATEAVSAADAAAAAGDTVTKAVFDAVVALANALKAALNDHLEKESAAGQMA